MWLVHLFTYFFPILLSVFYFNFQVDPLFQVPKGFERLWCIHINFIRCSSKPHFGNGKTQWTGICGDNFCLGPCYIVMLLLFAGRSKRFEHLHDHDPTYHGQSKTDSKLYIHIKWKYYSSTIYSSWKIFSSVFFIFSLPHLWTVLLSFLQCLEFRLHFIGGRIARQFSTFPMR